MFSCIFFFMFTPAMTMYESGNLAEVSQLLNQCLEEDESIKQCTLLKKVGALYACHILLYYILCVDISVIRP